MVVLVMLVSVMPVPLVMLVSVLIVELMPVDDEEVPEYDLVSVLPVAEPLVLLLPISVTVPVSTLFVSFLQATAKRESAKTAISTRTNDFLFIENSPFC